MSPQSRRGVRPLLNDLLGNATGYQLQRRRTGPARPPQKAAPAARTAAKKAAKKAAAKTAPPAPRGGRVPKHFDEPAREVIQRVKPRTMTSAVKLYALIQSVRYVVAADLPGSLVECGVWRGGSMQAAAWTLQAEGVTDRDLYLFDTFEGMPPPSEHDRRTSDGLTADELMQQRDKSHPVWAYAGLDDVRQGMAETGYPESRVHMVQGMVEETIPDGAPEEIAILRLDTDWYSSTKHEFDHLYSRLVPGGVLILDDYGHWDGARKATEEFLAELDHELLLLPMASGRIAVKPR